MRVTSIRSYVRIAPRTFLTYRSAGVEPANQKPPDLSPVVGYFAERFLELPFRIFAIYRYTVGMSFALSHTTRTYPKHIPYERMARDILGARYALSLVFVGEDRAQALNKQYRKKTYYPNVLSFPLSDTEGEIYICPMVARRQAQKYGMTVDGYIGFLFIHGLYHLKGHDHGDAMDAAEARAVKKYGLR